MPNEDSFLDFRNVCPSPPETEENRFAQPAHHQNENANIDDHYFHTRFRKASGLTDELLNSTEGTIVDVGGFGYEFDDTSRPVITVDMEENALRQSRGNVRIGFDLQNIPNALHRKSASLGATLKWYGERLLTIANRFPLSRRTPQIVDTQQRVQSLITLLTTNKDDVGLYMLSQICISLPPHVTESLLKTCLATVRPGGAVGIMDRAACDRATMPEILAGNSPGFDIARRLTENDPAFTVEEYMLVPVIKKEEFDALKETDSGERRVLYKEIIDRVKAGIMQTVRINVNEAGDMRETPMGNNVGLVEFGQHAMVIRKEG